MIDAKDSPSEDGGPTEEPPPTFAELAPALEFCFWVVVGLAPFLRWVNGAAVTTDQFVIQVTLTSLAVSGAVALRVYNWRWGKGARETRSIKSRPCKPPPTGTQDYQRQH